MAVLLIGCIAFLSWCASNSTMPGSVKAFNEEKQLRKRIKDKIEADKAAKPAAPQ
jgi:hypothetical protein